ncbi:hypothetical protein F4779DRAFT_639085 [Xylariaceae sp. FL0662B]|nr:hypothetical protein F4779DRAFT_639085 [Xylariaceae sp. FL0662B]
MSLRHLPRKCRLRPLSRPLAQKPPNHQAATPFLRPISSSSPHLTRMARAVQHRNTYAQVRFTAADVPPHAFWVEKKTRWFLDTDATPAECEAATKRYAALALEGSPGWRERLLLKDSNSGSSEQYALHYAAAAIIIVGGKSPAWSLALHMLHTLVTTGPGYAPSVLTLANIGLRRGLLDEPQMEPAREGLARLYKRRASADACTLMGLMHASVGTDEADDRALECFKAAGRVAEADPHREWQWQLRSALSAGKICQKRGRTDEALKFFRVGVYELDNAEACYLTATLLPEDDPDRVPLLEKAAISGVEAAARKLGQEELRGVDEEGLSREEKLARQVLADEWLAVAGDKALL